MIDQDKIAQAIKVLNQGGTILYKTDTIWGLGCDATSEEAVENIYKLKRRSHDKPFIVLMDSLQRVKSYVHFVHPRIETLLSFHKRPLTVIYNDPQYLPTNLTSKNNTIAIRISNNKDNVELIEQFDKPIVATSANYSGRPFPLEFEDIAESIIEKVDYILKLDGDDVSRSPSTMVKFTAKGELVFIRD